MSMLRKRNCPNLRTRKLLKSKK